MILAEHFLQSGPLHFQANNIPEIQHQVGIMQAQNILKKFTTHMKSKVSSSFPSR